MKEHPDFGSLLVAMKALIHRARPWSGDIYRSAPPKWATGKHMLMGRGSKIAGARFNAAGTFPAVYGSTTPELAMIESLAFQRRAGLPIYSAMPLVFKAISVELDVWIRQFITLFELEVLDASRSLPPKPSVADLHKLRPGRF